jgi:RNA polymerase sigma factor (sigma-70 family)
LEELEINRKAIKGDDDAFLEVMQLHKESLLRAALAFLKDEDAAIEALQEVTYRAYKKIHTIKEPAYLKTWLTRIMINYCQDQVKRKNRIISDKQLYDVSVHQNQSLIELKEALGMLSCEDQQLIYLKYFQNTKIKEIAAMENIPEGTVKSRLHKVLKTLRLYFKEKGVSDHV